MNHPRSRLLALNLTVLLALLGTVGCGTLKIPSYPSANYEGGRAYESQGLTLVADPIVDKERSETFFRTDLTKAGLAVVHLKAVNESPGATWLLRLEDIFLADGSGTPGPSAQSETIKSNYAAANAVGMAGAAVISFPLLIASGKLTKDAMVKEKNFVDKEWRNQTLSPGQSAEGFLYFRVSPENPWPAGAQLRINTLDVRSQQATTFLVPLGL